MSIVSVLERAKKIFIPEPNVRINCKKPAPYNAVWKTDHDSICLNYERRIELLERMLKEKEESLPTLHDVSMNKLVKQFRIALMKAEEEKSTIISMVVDDKKLKVRFEFLLKSYGYHVFTNQCEMNKNEIIELGIVDWSKFVVVRMI